MELVKPGDRVVISTHLYCGVCINCARGLSAACLRVRPGGFGAAYGYAGMGPYRGAQAEPPRSPRAGSRAACVAGATRMPSGRPSRLRDQLIGVLSQRHLSVDHEAVGPGGPAVTGRFTQLAAVADLVLFLASDRTANVTGADFAIDGGLITTS